MTSLRSIDQVHALLVRHGRPRTVSELAAEARLSPRAARDAIRRLASQGRVARDVAEVDGALVARWSLAHGGAKRWMGEQDAGRSAAE
jgi:DNA-binding Lrp family transcriptional regulator